MTLTRGTHGPHAVGWTPGSARAPRGGWRLVGWILVILGAGAGFAFAVGFVLFAGAIARNEPRDVAQTDGIVVLTGGSQRLTDGLSLLAAGQGRRLLISGVYQHTSREEIARTASYRGAKLDCCVDLGKSALNTIGNAIEARRWARANGFGSLLVVTSNYHLPRTLGEFQHVMQGVRLVGYPVVSDGISVQKLWSDPPTFRIVASEYAKYVVSRLRHLIEGDPEHSRWPVLVGRQKPVGPHAIERADQR